MAAGPEWGLQGGAEGSGIMHCLVPTLGLATPPQPPPAVAAQPS